MNRLRSTGILLLLSALLFAPLDSNAEIIDYIVVYYPSISPNGDGVQDSSPVEVSLSVPALFLSVTLEDTLSSTVYDTLLAETGADADLWTCLFDGTDSLGAPLAEGPYRLVIFATDGDTTETYLRNVIIDITTPVVTLDRIEPGAYTPDIPGTAEEVSIYFDITGLGEGDSLEIAVTDPLGIVSLIPHSVDSDGSHMVLWSADESARDGLYRVDLSLEDEAGNASSDVGFINVDTKGPDLILIDPVAERVNSVPELQSGSCHDRNGITDPQLVWNNGEPFAPSSLVWDADTLFWSFDLRDSTMIGGSYVERTCTLTVLCSDLLGHEESARMIFAVDLTPPNPPVMRQPVSPVHVSEATVRGTVAVTDTVKAFRAAQGDTISSMKVPLTDLFAFTFDVLPGVNYFWAIAADVAGNWSEPSNIVQVVYEDAAGLYFPEAFRGADMFEILTPREALGVEITIFTVSGERVRRLAAAGPDDQFQIEWDLTNDAGQTVHNGAYLVVIEIRYDTGTTVEKSFIAVVR